MALVTRDIDRPEHKHAVGEDLEWGSGGIAIRTNKAILVEEVLE